MFEGKEKVMGKNISVGISYGILAESIGNQLKKQSLLFDKEKIDNYDKCKDAINELRMSDLLTDGYVDKILQKLHKKIIAHVAKKNRLTNPA